MRSLSTALRTSLHLCHLRCGHLGLSTPVHLRLTFPVVSLMCLSCRLSTWVASPKTLSMAWRDSKELWACSTCPTFLLMAACFQTSPVLRLLLQMMQLSLPHLTRRSRLPALLSAGHLVHRQLDVQRVFALPRPSARHVHACTHQAHHRLLFFPPLRSTRLSRHSNPRPTTNHLSDHLVLPFAVVPNYQRRAHRSTRARASPSLHAACRSTRAWTTTSVCWAL